MKWTPTKPAVSVHISNFLTAALEASGEGGAAEFVRNFKVWRTLCDQSLPDGVAEKDGIQNPRNDSAFMFGRDGYYRAPLSGKQQLIRHVHLVPVVKLDDLDDWKVEWDRIGERTSDRALVYVWNKNQNSFLLIDILPEPSAHIVCKMLTSETKAIMNHFLHIAEQFYFFGKIVF